MKRKLFCIMIASLIFALFCSVGTVTADETLPPPHLTITVDGTKVTAAWTKVQNAAGYLLYYAPYPKMFPIESIDMGNQNSLTVDLPIGAAYYVAVKAYKEGTDGFLSNITYFIVGDKTLPAVNNGSCVNIAGNWIYSQLYYGSGCGVGDWSEWGPIEIRQNGCEVTVLVDGEDTYKGTVTGNEVDFNGVFYIEGIKLVEDGHLVVLTNRKMTGNSKVTAPEYGCTMDSYIEIIR